MQSFCLSYLLPECTPASDAHQTMAAVRGRRQTETPAGKVEAELRPFSTLISIPW